MLYEALSQPTIFLWLSFGGFFSGFLFDIKKIISFYSNKNKVIEQILLFFASFLTFSCCFLLNLFFNYGQFRFFSILAFVLSFSIQRFLLTNFVANPCIKWYNKIKEKHNERKKEVATKI